MIRKFYSFTFSLLALGCAYTATAQTITTLAGTGTAGYTADGVAASTSGLNNPYGVAVDAAGNVYIADNANHRIRKVAYSTGIITTIAGTGGTYGFSGDNGPATSAALAFPTGVAVDSSGKHSHYR